MRRRILRSIIKPTNAKSIYPIKSFNGTDEFLKKIQRDPHVQLNENTVFLPINNTQVFILGGGPSLNKIDLSFLDGKDVICVNKSIDLVKNPKYFITMDYSFFLKINKSPREIAQLAQNSHFVINKQHSFIQKVNGFYVDTKHKIKYEGLEHFTSVISSVKETDEMTGFGQSFSEFSHGENSGYCAIQFAILAGYTEIYLLGFDMFSDHNAAQTHFHTEYSNFSINRFYENLKKYKKYIIESVVKLKNKKSLKIYTLTPSSLEPIISKVSFSKFKNSQVHNDQTNMKVTSKNNLDNLIIVAYYTINTPYETEAKKLISSLYKLGLNYDVIGVPNLGSWQSNTRFKAKFMEDMLNKHQGKNLLYVDSDAIIHSKPVLFKDYTADIAVRWQNFRWRENECLSGTIFMANNEKTRKLCQRWQQVNISEGVGATTFEQWNLGKVIKEMESEGEIISKNLPPEYTMIFDSMREMYPGVVPVIEHFQASRKYRNKI